MQTERSKQLEYNLSVLKRRDGAIKEVLDMAGHVVMYRFNEDSQSWDRKNVEGSLFIVERVAAPKYQFVVLNRRSSENLVESINEDFQMELTEQFLLYRNSAQEINGIWFYSPTERTAVAELLTSLSSAADVKALPSASFDGPAQSPVAESEVDPETVQQNPGESETPSTVAHFFNMIQIQQDAQAMPPMPTCAITHSRKSPSEPSQPSSANQEKVSAAASSSTPTVPKPPDVESLKEHLRTQLQALLLDDGFMNVLALEYLRQRKASAASNSNQKARVVPSQRAVASPEQPPSVQQQP